MHQAKSGRLIIKLDKEVRVGDILLDAKGKKVAKVMEIIGPVDAPYASAVALTDRVKKYIGSKVYLKERKRRR
ncbi:MAG: hypothetical protein D6752_04625 [Candidatus Nitrosothermus koennekii]|nr:MAG: hypothetical protein D6752_04625 [Candidatus Nitrosothermus koennekii]